MSTAADRFLDRGLIAQGGMGEVRRAWDTRLCREVALKTVLSDRACEGDASLRIEAEAKITARLQHPGVLCVIDSGFLDDGRFWYAMPLIAGATLTEEIRTRHDEVARGLSEGPSVLFRLMSQFLRVCEVMAFAHDRRVVHRDLKPSNVMVGRFGEVYVMDWGVAKDLDGEPETLPGVAMSIPIVGTGLTTYGQALGTPAYMPPEQAMGALDEVGPWSDVYALGGILHEVLTGAPPWPPRLTPGQAPLRPDAALVALCLGALAEATVARPADAGALAAAVRGWLEGAQRRAAALVHVREAEALAVEVARKRAAALELRQEARTLQAGIATTAAEALKLPVWRLEDAAVGLERAGRVDVVGVEQHLRMALSLSADDVQARRLLAEHYRDRLLAAEQIRDADTVAEAEALLRANDGGLYAEWLQGDAKLTLDTDPSGAEVFLSTYAERDRRLVPTDRRRLGRTPLEAVAIPRGSHLLEIEHGDRPTARLPVRAGRLEHVRWVRPGEATPRRVLLPKATDLGPDEVYVPPGMFQYQGDPSTAEPIPARLIWVDGFIIARHPVTLGAYIEWLNALVDAGDEPEAIRCAPLLPPDEVGSNFVRRIPRFPRGRFALTAELEHLRDWPLSLVDWHAAMGYAAFRSRMTGLPWRLPHEIEREKAGRGADGRIYPWGDFPEPTWSRNAGASEAGPLPGTVEAFPRDESPYGVRGLAGNVRDWCLNVWRADGGGDEGAALILEPPGHDDPAYRAIRGGCWSVGMAQCRLTERYVGWPGERYPTAGIRLVRSWP
ncbi:bifunctional serine/threonine-protein kinase/formylglycine-generating enzyme family protein [Myxococcota bacterium]|nr:bifunctional serine/threonine-protein kinase/formylglycine-generating enzyme family protein [Myxococcota bacterium]